jgi:phage-related protein
LEQQIKDGTIHRGRINAAKATIGRIKKNEEEITENLFQNFSKMGSFVTSIHTIAYEGAKVCYVARAAVDFISTDKRIDMFREQDTLLSTAAVWMSLLIELSKVYTGKLNVFKHISSLMSSVRSGAGNIGSSVQKGLGKMYSGARSGVERALEWAADAEFDD